MGNGWSKVTVKESEGSTKGVEGSDLFQVSKASPLLFCHLEQIFDKFYPQRRAGPFFGEESRLSEEETERRVSAQQRHWNLLQPAPHRMLLRENGCIVQLFYQMHGALEFLGGESGFDSFYWHGMCFIPTA